MRAVGTFFRWGAGGTGRAGLTVASSYVNHRRTDRWVESLSGSPAAVGLVSLWSPERRRRRRRRRSTRERYSRWLRRSEYLEVYERVKTLSTTAELRSLSENGLSLLSDVNGNSGVSVGGRVGDDVESLACGR